MLRRMKIGTRVNVLIAVPLLAMIALTLVSYVSLQRASVRGDEYKQLKAAEALRSDIVPPAASLLDAWAIVNHVSVLVSSPVSDYTNRQITDAMQQLTQARNRYGIAVAYWRGQPLDQRSKTAFEQGAVDYVMKPFSPARLAVTIERLKEKAGRAPASLDGLLQLLRKGTAPKEYLRWITATQGQDLRLITVDEICYFQADSKYTLVVTAQQESLIRRAIKELVQELDPTQFWQIHRGTVININAVAGLTRDFGGQLRVKLKDRKETLAVSEPYVHLFKQM